MADTVTEQTDYVFCAQGEDGPVPRTGTMQAAPFFDENALQHVLERAEGGGAAVPVSTPSPFLFPDVCAAADSGALRDLLDGADWPACAPDRDLLPLRERLGDWNAGRG